MPRKYAKKRAPLKRKYRRRGKKAVINRSMVTLGRGFPKMIKATHTYVDNVTFSGVSGVSGNYLFSCNGMYDPNITGTGHQPMYFDQFTPLYDHYCVIGSKIDVKILSGTTSTVPYCAGIYINDDTSVLTNFTQQNEQPTAHYVFVPFAQNNQIRLTNSWSAKKYFSQNPLANDELQGTIAANPVEQSYFDVYVSALDGSSSVSVFCEVTVTYIAIWKELKEVAQS